MSTIDATIKSVLNQTFKNIEYLVIDGASTDGTVALLEKYQQQNVLKFVSETDSGLYEAMNKGIKLSTGDLIIFLNAGDYFVSKDVIDFYVSKIDIKKADLFFGRIVWNDPINKEICLSDNNSTIYTSDLKSLNFPHPATLYKKDLFHKVGLFDLSYKILADYDWNVRALVMKKIKFQYINIIVTVFFVDGISNEPNSANKRQQEAKKIYQRYFRPRWLFSFVENYADKRQRKNIKERVLVKFYNKKLNRVY